MKRTVIALTASLLFTLTACGGGVSTDDIADGLAADGEFSKSQAKCVAELLKDSDISDERLQAIVDGTDEDIELTSEEDEVMESLDFESCR